VKRVARTAGKPYTALRSSSLTSFAAALRSMAAREGSAAAVDAAPELRRA
jgi:hypothetical protein